MSKPVEVKLVADRYIGEFYKRGRNGHGWEKFHQIGNAGVAEDVASMLEKLGHKVEREWVEEEDV
jgi:hypothetical protein